MHDLGTNFIWYWICPDCPKNVYEQISQLLYFQHLKLLNPVPILAN